jgi:hypothetical protein
VPVDIGPGRYVLDFDYVYEVAFAEAIFTYQGDMLRGDPIYLQTSGPELLDSWWSR